MDITCDTANETRASTLYRFADDETFANVAKCRCGRWEGLSGWNQIEITFHLRIVQWKLIEVEFRNWKIWANWIIRTSFTHRTMDIIWVSLVWSKGKVSHSNSMCAFHFWFAVQTLSRRVCKLYYIRFVSFMWLHFFNCSFSHSKCRWDCIEYWFGAHIPGHGWRTNAPAHGRSQHIAFAQESSSKCSRQMAGHVFNRKFWTTWNTRAINRKSCQSCGRGRCCRIDQTTRARNRRRRRWDRQQRWWRWFVQMFTLNSNTISSFNTILFSKQKTIMRTMRRTIKMTQICPLTFTTRIKRPPLPIQWPIRHHMNMVSSEHGGLSGMD